MNCIDRTYLLSEMLDGELDEERSHEMRLHLIECSECATAFEQLSSIYDACKFENLADDAPANSDAMWCRISNVIEGEMERDRIAQIAAEPETPSVKRFSFFRVSAVFATIALISSVATIMVLRGYYSPQMDDFTSRSAQTQTPFEKVMSKVGLMDSPQEAREKRFREQHAAISYWDARVAARRQQWDGRTRDAFDRNIKVIDQSLDQYQAILEQDPDDELSAEMLDSVLNDKMNLLRDFSDL